MQLIKHPENSSWETIADKTPEVWIRIADIVDIELRTVIPPVDIDYLVPANIVMFFSVNLNLTVD